MSWFSKLNPLRRKSAGMTSRDLLELIASGAIAVSGVEVNSKSAIQYAAFFACLKVLAEDVGKLPIKLYKERPDRGRDVAKAHPVHRIISRRPNDFMTASEFWEMCVAHVILRGNFYAYKVMVGSELKELLPLNPASTKPVQRSDWSIWYDITFADGRRDIVPASSIFHVRGLTLDGINGLSALEYARETLGLGIAAERHGAKLFVNGANPGGALQTDQTLTDEVFERVKTSWNEKHSGLDNSHKVAILEGGLKWVSVTMTNTDAQWLENRKHTDNQICGMLRVPPHKVAILDRSTNNNIEHQSLDYVNDGLMPHLNRIESRIRISLLDERDEEDHFAKFNVSALLRGDMKARSQFYKDMVYIGAYSPNDVLELEDRNPRPNGDIYLTPSNMNINGRLADEDQKHA